MQHDHHCLLVINGHILRITAVYGLGDLRCYCTGCGTPHILDLSNVRWDEYCEWAVLNDYANAMGAVQGTA